MVTDTWERDLGNVDWCAYIDGPGAPASGSLLVGQATYVLPVPASKPPVSRHRYALTLRNASSWAGSAVLDHFFRGRGPLPADFRARSCMAVGGSGERIRCDVRWSHAGFSFAGTVVLGSVDTQTGGFRFGFNLVRTQPHTSARKHIVVPY